MGYIGGRVLLMWMIWFVGIVCVVLLLCWFKKKDGKFFVYYLMYDYVFLVKYCGVNLFEFEVCMVEFVVDIVGVLIEDVDEVLIVGYLLGVYFVVLILFDLIW